MVLMPIPKVDRITEFEVHDPLQKSAKAVLVTDGYSG